MTPATVNDSLSVCWTGLDERQIEFPLLEISRYVRKPPVCTEKGQVRPPSWQSFRSGGQEATGAALPFSRPHWSSVSGDPGSCFLPSVPRPRRFMADEGSHALVFSHMRQESALSCSCPPSCPTPLYWIPSN